MAVKALRSMVRAVDRRDAPAVVRLHRELWLDHDARGGMPASHEDAVWDGYANVLERQLYHRSGRRLPAAVFDGKLGHLIAEHDGRVVGQVEVCIDRYGFAIQTPHVAELRSLIVADGYRGLGLGSSLVREAASSARSRGGDRTLVVAEVLARNNALAFYTRHGFRTLERLTLLTEPPPIDPAARWAPVVSAASRGDAHDLANLDHAARCRRQVWGDPRFDPPSPSVGSELVHVITSSILADEAEQSLEHGRIRQELIARAPAGEAHAAAYLVASLLGPPFAPVIRAEVARLAADAEVPNGALCVDAILRDAFARARAVGARDLLVRTPFLDPAGERVAQYPGARPFSWILAAHTLTVLGKEQD